MFSIIKDWHEFRVHLSSLNDWLKANAGESYKGMSADSKLTIWFEAELSAEILAAVDAKWDGLTAEAEGAKLDLDAKLADAELAAKEALLTADLSTLIIAERKLLMNMPLNDEDRANLLAKYPQ